MRTRVLVVTAAATLIIIAASLPSCKHTTAPGADPPPGVQPDSTDRYDRCPHTANADVKLSVCPIPDPVRLQPGGLLRLSWTIWNLSDGYLSFRSSWRLLYPPLTFTLRDAKGRVYLWDDRLPTILPSHEDRLGPAGWMGGPALLTYGGDGFPPVPPGEYTLEADFRYRPEGGIYHDFVLSIPVTLEGP